jgi:hypothetical protein
MRCVFPDFENDSFHIQIQHVVVFATKWLETLLLKLNGLKGQNISVCLKYRTNVKLHYVMCINKIPFDQMSLLLCSHYFPHPAIFLYSGLFNHLI